MNMALASIYVSHHSETYINKFSARHAKELGEAVYVVNSCDCLYSDLPDSFTLIEAGKNVGFSAANNMGVAEAKKQRVDFLMFINPDIFLPSGWLESVKSFITQQEYDDVGIFTVPLLGYDIDNNEATDLIDSVGIYPTWYGRWRDRLAGQSVSEYDVTQEPYEVPAICGALMIIPMDVIETLLDEDGYIFNESYFMYKEDIELSIRVRKLCKRIMMLPSLPVFHCRGWAKDRSNSTEWGRKLSALNEFKLHLKFYWRYLPYSFVKYIYVQFIETPMFKLTGRRK